MIQVPHKGQYVFQDILFLTADTEFHGKTISSRIKLQTGFQLYTAKIRISGKGSIRLYICRLRRLFSSTVVLVAGAPAPDAAASNAGFPVFWPPFCLILLPPGFHSLIGFSVPIFQKYCHTVFTDPGIASKSRTVTVHFFYPISLCIILKTCIVYITATALYCCGYLIHSSFRLNIQRLDPFPVR